VGINTETLNSIKNFAVQQIKNKYIHDGIIDIIQKTKAGPVELENLTLKFTNPD